MMYMSASDAPEASRLGWFQLNSRPRTGPWCLLTVATSASPSAPSTILLALKILIEPSTMPPASTPSGYEAVSTPVPHASRWKRSLVVTLPSSGISALGEASSRLKISSCAVLSKLSSIAPATVPAASRPGRSAEVDQATVPERLTDLSFDMPARHAPRPSRGALAAGA